MSRLKLVQHVFATRAQAESYLDSIASMAWPYAWCAQDPDSGRWKVTALVETDHLRAAS